MKRANSLRNKKDLGMVKKERQVIRELLEGPTRRRSAPHPSSGGAAYEVGGVKIEKLLAANKELKAWQGKLVRATADLISAVKKSEEGSWKADLRLKEEDLRKWLGEQLSWMSKIQEGLDWKGGELAKRTMAKEKQGKAEVVQITGYRRNGENRM